jgi:magnesium chelatase family protein
VAARVSLAHGRMAQRNPDGVSNARLTAADLRRLAQPDGAALRLWEQAVEQGRISARGGERVLRVARTISDLEGHERITTAALAEALLYRSFDQQVAGS